HDFTFAGQCRNRETVSHSLAKGGQMGDDLMKFLSSSQMPAESGDHLVENEHGAPFLAELLDRFQIAGGRRSGCFRFHQNTSDLTRMLVEEISQTREIVERKL